MVGTGLQGKAALVTGANHGIGAATAVALSREGVDIFLTYLRLSPDSGGAVGPEPELDAGEPGRAHYLQNLGRDAGEVLAAIRALGGRCESWEADLADPGNIPRLLDRAETAFGRVDILVNNAAHAVQDTFLPDPEIPRSGLFGGEYPLLTITAGSHDGHFAVNSRAVALLTADFARRLIARKAGWGRVINISTDGASGHGWSVSYGASKWAAESYARAAALELGPYGITVNVISPGAVQTGWLPRDEAETIARTYPLRRIGSPGDIAAAAVFFASRQADWITGQVLNVGGGHRM